MLIRLLVVVLTLVGPMPFRVCTCAASVPAQSTAGVPGPAAPVKLKKCRCAGCGPSVGTAPTGDTGSAKCEAASPLAPHDRDCPAVNAQPAVRDAGTPPAPDAPTDHDATFARVTVEPLTLAGASLSRRTERPYASRTPLYITLLSLRN